MQRPFLVSKDLSSFPLQGLARTYLLFPSKVSQGHCPFRDLVPEILGDLVPEILGDLVPEIFRVLVPGNFQGVSP